MPYFEKLMRSVNALERFTDWLTGLITWLGVAACMVVWPAVLILFFAVLLMLIPGFVVIGLIFIGWGYAIWRVNYRH